MNRQYSLKWSDSGEVRCPVVHAFASHRVRLTNPTGKLGADSAAVAASLVARPEGCGNALARGETRQTIF